MINGIIKLFYSEVVKSKMKNMPSKDYCFRKEFEDISNIAMKIDNFFIIAFKVIVMTSIILISLSINLIFGFGIILILIAYSLYKIYIEKQIKDQVREGIGYIKNNIEQGGQNLGTDNIKQKINVLITLLLIGIFSNFNYIIIGCFILVFMFTIKDIYSNINK
ncbi:hypothetical protein H8697_04470 [[Eubacterium] tenue]|nr:hypothetical protein [[Eubacterium] tenue]MBC8630961.1 hypothetical protein [[Eubacterium] tenue]